MQFWEFKFKDDLWEGFEKLEVGDVFDTTITEKKLFSNSVGDIVFWYRTDRKKDVVRGIYFVCKVVSEVKENENYSNGYSIDMRILKKLVDKPFVLEQNGFKKLHEKLNTTKYKGRVQPREKIDQETGERLLQKLSVEQDVPQLESHQIDKTLVEKIKVLKDENIDNGIMFNPFLDMNLIKGEVKHLSFLANLLNPHGTHYHREIFLKHFFEVLLEYEHLKENLYLQNFDVKNAKVQTEKLTNNNKRIDIWIEDDDFIVAIEGKIEASDTKEQLLNYDNYLKELGKPYLLCFLTKYGDEPNHKCPENLLQMSFKSEIYDVVDRSLKEQLHPKVQNTVNEYKNALMTYLYDLEPTWNYSLDIINEITKNEKNFIKYRDIKDSYYYDTAKYQFSVIEDIASIFEKAKAKIELDFFVTLDERLKEILKKHDYDSYDCFLYIESGEDLSYPDTRIVEYKNINIMSNTRRDRIHPKTLGRVQLAYRNESINNEVTITSDSYGLVIGSFNDGDIVTQKDIDRNIFHMKNIEQMLNKDIRNKQLDKIESIVKEFLE